MIATIQIKAEVVRITKICPDLPPLEDFDDISCSGIAVLVRVDSSGASSGSRITGERVGAVDSRGAGVICTVGREVGAEVEEVSVCGAGVEDVSICGAGVEEVSVCGAGVEEVTICGGTVGRFSGALKAAQRRQSTEGAISFNCCAPIYSLSSSQESSDTAQTKSLSKRHAPTKTFSQVQKSSTFGELLLVLSNLLEGVTQVSVFGHSFLDHKQCPLVGSFEFTHIPKAAKFKLPS
mmetsp:Transcript_2852/g.3368  ORF Transcript_2852/g.3368 Transcript_2852/m.3368 type:complete len:236 (-) Transcript_2852:27-734(-)